MNRRSFFRFAASAPIAVASSQSYAGAPSDFRRLSSEVGDPGERGLAMLRADGLTPITYLDGVEQEFVCTCDVDLGMVRRAVTSPGGNICVGNDGECLIETVYGRVEIRVR